VSAQAGGIVQRLQRLSTHAGPAVVAYALCTLGIATFWPTFVGLARVWRESADYSHGFLVALAAAIWLGLLRERIDASPVRPVWTALPALAIAIAVWVIAYRGNSQIVQQLVTPLAIALAVLAALGVQVTRQVLPPILYLYFAIPIWDQLLPVLQMLTTNVAEGVLRVLQVPTVVESHLVTIPEGRFAIVEGCSGKRYLVVGLSFATLLAASYGLQAKRAAMLIAATAGLSLLANWVRVIVIIYAGHVSNMEHYLVAREHLTFGWFMFLPLLTAVIFTARALARSERPADAATRRWGDVDSSRSAWFLPAACLCIPVLAVGTQAPQGSSTARLGQLPLMAGEWQGPLPAGTTWQPRFIAPADQRRVAYTSPEGEVQLYLNVYGAQTQGHELIFFANSVVPEESWSVVRALPERDDMLMVIAADAAGDHWAVARTYSIRGRLTSSAALAQFYYGLSALWRPVPSGTIALAAACRPDCAQAQQRIRRFWLDRGHAIANVIPNTLM
jgi:exosortase A